MNLLPIPLPPLPNPDTSMWVDEAIWGHRLYDEQSPWLVFLEFLNVFHHEYNKGRAFTEPDGFNTLCYSPAKRLCLRNILFNNPKLDEIRIKHTTDSNRWGEWFKYIKTTVQGVHNPTFDYLKKHFHSFEDFCEIVSLVRSTSLEVNSNKRWTSKFVFPYGKDCLYEDLDKNASSNDRRFFGRTGEVLYLMLCRSQLKQELLFEFKGKVLQDNSNWNIIIKCLQPDDDDSDRSKRANAFLPYEKHSSFDDLAKDWLAILKLNMPGFDMLPHIVNLTGLHLLKYQLTISQQILGVLKPTKIVCEVVAPKKTLVREISCEIYQENNLLSARAVESYISQIENSEEWQRAITESGAFARCRQILKDRVLWGEDYEGPNDPVILIKELRSAALKRHRQHVGNIHRNYGREVGLVSKRGTIKLRYAPNDNLLRTIIFANVERRMELNQFLNQLYQRYNLIFSDKEAEQFLQKNEFDKKAFQANSHRLEQRLSSLGLLQRLSDGCAYIINPYNQKFHDK